MAVRVRGRKRKCTARTWSFSKEASSELRPLGLACPKRLRAVSPPSSVSIRRRRPGISETREVARIISPPFLMTGYSGRVRGWNQFRASGRQQQRSEDFAHVSRFVHELVNYVLGFLEKG